MIIDEFELSKSVINDFLIRESVGKMADMVSMFRMLMGRALEGRQIDGKGGDGNARCGVHERTVPQSFDKIGYGPKLRAEFNGIVSAAEEAYLELHLDKQFRLSDRLRYKNQPFLFSRLPKPYRRCRRQFMVGVVPLPSKVRTPSNSVRALRPMPWARL